MLFKAIIAGVMTLAVIGTAAGLSINCLKKSLKDLDHAEKD